MNNDEIFQRIQFLKKVVRQELKHLLYSDQQVFNAPLTIEQVKTLSTDESFAEKVEAFGSRFGRLQDTIGYKLLSLWLIIIGEKPAAFIDNLNRAEKLGVLPSSEEWMRLRELRNQMVHEYIDENAILLNALQSAHKSIPFIQIFINNLLKDFNNRGY